MSNPKNDKAPGATNDGGPKVNSSSKTVTHAHDYIETCVACRKKLDGPSYRGTVITRTGLAAFRICPPCRDSADDAMLARIMREAEQRLVLTGPPGGHA